MDQKFVFALDIGTRKIVGLVMEKTGDHFRVIGSEMREHQTRAMMDGQIHDVEAVAHSILDIKETLEARLNIKLESAAVAAAGRSLKTSSANARKQRSTAGEVTQQEVTALELEAVQAAQYLLSEEECLSGDHNHYFCVGYSVVSYQLENQKLANLVGQIGSELAVEVVATFLPRVVVDSLFSSLKRANLSVQSLTLEPIAAISVAIPVNMRMLNLALVDIGAGTADIALVRNGNVSAYAMVPSGGDELTEKLASHYLLDFLTAESLKRCLQTNDMVNFTDILGNYVELPAAEVNQVLEPTAREIALAIAENILYLNQKAPDAVLCIGGGSLTVKLTGLLASALNLPGNRVGIRTPEVFTQISLDSDYLQGPQGVTPLGIAYHSLTTPVVPFINVVVNERGVPLWNMGSLSVSGSLLSSGISLANMYGKPGLGKTLELNGKVKVFKGEMGTPPYIELNGQPASLDSTVQDGDRIIYRRGSDGRDARVAIGDIIPLIRGNAWVNGELIQLEPSLLVNGAVWEPEKEIPDRAKIEFTEANQVNNVLRQAGVPENMLRQKTYHYRLNDKEMQFDWMPVQVKVNGQPCNLEDIIEFGAQVEFQLISAEPRIRDLQPSQELLKIRVKVNGEPAEVTCRQTRLLMNGQEVSWDALLIDGADIKIVRSQTQAILSDIFRVVEVKPTVNGKLTIRVNGMEAGFTTPIADGSEIELRWDS